MKYHRFTVTALTSAWAFLALWLWPRAVRAGTLANEFKAFDWLSLGYAGALGLLGGILALIVALATDHRVVKEVFKEGGRNALVSPIAGCTAYLVLEGLASFGPTYQFTTVIRFLVIVGAGYAGISFFVWARGVVAQGAGGLGQWLVNRFTPKES